MQHKLMTVDTDLSKCANTNTTPQKPPSRVSTSIHGDQFLSPFHIFIRKVFLPGFLSIWAPTMVIILWYTNTYHDASFASLATSLLSSPTRSKSIDFDLSLSSSSSPPPVVGILPTIAHAFGPIWKGSVFAWAFLGTHYLFQIVLMLVLPGKFFKGPITPRGNVPEYYDNGLLAYLISMMTFSVFIVAPSTSFASYFAFFNPAHIYDQFGYVLGAANTAGLIFAAMLLVKGYIAPSTTDTYITGNPIFDYYYGVELYPRIGPIDIKRLTNCRGGMILWPLILVAFAYKQYTLYGYLADSMIVAITLQLVYITKFFIWESGYMFTIDIMHDRAGLYICWGCIAFIPSVYTCSTLYLVERPVHLGWPTAMFVLVVGILSIYFNYQADQQKQAFRTAVSKDKSILIWGKKPQFINAQYRTEAGEFKESKLLTSGHWGIARHSNYFWELLAAFSWCVPAGFNHLLPYFYWLFLFVLFIDRTLRDERRCKAKYGMYWDQYCDAVPYRLIPGVL